MILKSLLGFKIDMGFWSLVIIQSPDYSNAEEFTSRLRLPVMAACLYRAPAPARARTPGQDTVAKRQRIALVHGSR